MTRRKLEDKNVRKIFRSGSSYAITIPKEMIEELGWKSKQKVIVKKRGDNLSIADWKK